jgi:hypothetical protein
MLNKQDMTVSPERCFPMTFDKQHHKHSIKNDYKQII